MDSNSNSDTFAWRANKRGWHRPFAGVTPARVGTVIALCAVWTFSVTIHDALLAWSRGAILEWLVWRAGAEFACILIIAATMALPLVVVGNLAPALGWRRFAALTLTIALAAPIAAAVRYHFLWWLNDEPPSVHHGLLVTWWARYAQLAALVTIVMEFQRRETRSVEAMHAAEIDRLALEREMDEARLRVLEAQIEPHFLFNTLANVRRLYQTDRAAGRQMLQNLMSYLEVALPHMRSHRSSVGRELALVEAYLGVQRIRMGARLAFSIDVPAEAHRLLLPPMMLLTLVENAIKHGLNPMPEGGRVAIRARVDGGRLDVEVEDDGRGFHASSGGGTGLANIRDRLAAAFAGAASLTLVERVPHGVGANLSLPALAGEA